MIRNSTDRDTELLFRNERNRGYNAIAQTTPDHRLPLIAQRATWGALAKDRKKLTSGIKPADQLTHAE